MNPSPAYTVLCGDVLETLALVADDSVHCVVTSPPYWRLRSYLPAGHPAKADEIGMEPTPEAYVERMVAAFREVRRVLRPDGTLWLNLGDTYATGAGKARSPGGLGHTSYAERIEASAVPMSQPNRMPQPGLKPKDLVGIPWMVAFALRADGWYLRSEVIWEKPSAMQESATDRPSRSHEHLFLLTKSPQYFYDVDAVREPLKDPRDNTPADRDRLINRRRESAPVRRQAYRRSEAAAAKESPLGRNKRTVWTIASVPNKAASKHFAAYPPKLVEPCIRAGTSERGVCPTCGTGWVRITASRRQATRPGLANAIDATGKSNRDRARHVTQVFHRGWRPACLCYADAYRALPRCRSARKRVQQDAAGSWAARMLARPAPDDWAVAPAVVLDPFSGTATTGAVALAEGRSYLGIELHPDHHAESLRRLQAILDAGALPLFDSAPAAEPEAETAAASARQPTLLFAE